MKLKIVEINENEMNSFVKPFNLSEGPLIRVGIVNKNVLIIDIHHIICDGSAISIIKRELNKFYENQEVTNWRFNLAIMPLIWMKRKRVDCMMSNTNSMNQCLMMNTRYSPFR